MRVPDEDHGGMAVEHVVMACEAELRSRVPPAHAESVVCACRAVASKIGPLATGS